jgi:predicted regulator of Ras-like GTPase activity (Roadblock/LC7/MglB family)
MVKKRGTYDTMTVEEGAVIEIQEVQEEQEAITVPTENEDPDYAKLLDAIQEIRKRTEVVGYILKSDSKATVDLNDSAKIIEYAMLSSQTFEAANALASTFMLGVTENILLEGKNLKVLCLDLGQNKISIFMEKTTDHTSILKALDPQIV